MYINNHSPAQWCSR